MTAKQRRRRQLGVSGASLTGWPRRQLAVAEVLSVGVAQKRTSSSLRCLLEGRAEAEISIRLCPSDGRPRRKLAVVGASCGGRPRRQLAVDRADFGDGPDEY